MTPQEIRVLLQHLQTSDHLYYAIRPADATPAEAPGILLHGASANDLAFAVDAAAAIWPNATTWALIAGDELLQRTGDDGPPDMAALQMPETLATFGGASVEP